MTSTDDKAKAAMRAYADTIQPPPVAEIIARAEHTQDAPNLPGTARPRSRRPILIAAAAAVAVVAVAADRLPARGPDAPTGPTATQPSASAGAIGAAPGCPPALPMLEGGPHDIEGTLVKPIVAKPGQHLTLPAQIRPEAPDRALRSFMLYLVPSRKTITERDKASGAPLTTTITEGPVSESPVLRLAPDQRRVSPVLPIPAGLAPGRYDVIGYGTFPSPSVCGLKNPPNAPDNGTIQGLLARVVIN